MDPQMIRVIESIGQPNWTDVVQAIGVSITLLISIVGFIMLIHQASILVRQAKSEEEAIRLQTKAIQLSEAARIHQVLFGLFMEYRSTEMLLAIRTLWDLYRDNPSTFVDIYEAARYQDSARIAALPSDKRLQAEQGTIHYQRRLVSGFYAFLAELYELEIISRQLLYTHWGESTLDIIPKILIPIEKRLISVLNVPTGPNLTLERMMKLYNDSKVP